MENAMIDEIMQSEAGQELVRRYQQDKRQQRREQFQALAELRARRGEARKPLLEKLGRTRQAVEAAQSSLKQAEEDRQVQESFDAQIRRIERELVTTAPTEIDAFIQSLWDEIEALRQNGTASRQEPTEKIYATGELEMRRLSNQRSLERRMAALRETAAVAEKYKLQDIEDLQERLDALVADLPPVAMEMM
jgi:hypothetical protein